MPTCFLIQPFDRGKFDKRFEDIFRPAIEEAGLEPYRVDQDLQVEVPIEAIEDGIREAAICLADITTDNPNVWYELGFAFAADKPVVMVCSDERKERRYPFDIQHRTVVSYQSESSRDFEELKLQIKQRIVALLNKREQLRQLAESDPIAPREGLSQPELAVLAIVAGDAAVPNSTTSIYSLKQDVGRAGFTPIGFGLGLRRLLRKGYVECFEIQDGRGDYYTAVTVSQLGWDYIEANEEMFSILKVRPQDDKPDDDIPF